METDFLIVGVGASAGGIRAVKEFFEQVPAGSGAAYVVILHLSPNHDSHLAEVLQASAVIPVTQVHARVRVQPDRVYVIPPSQSLSIRDGHLELSDMTRIEERRAPIDIFFRTLADSHGMRAVCVVLSGTGADGSMGLKRVKEHGGICLVQDPGEAEYRDMPHNAIATRLVDDILPVAMIPARIAAYDARRRALHLDEAPADQPPDETAVRDILVQLQLRTGHDFSNYKKGTMLRRVGRRMGIQDISSLPDYARYLREHPGETAALLKDLLISVTNFFRDRKAFETLERTVVPRLFAAAGGHRVVRVWVAGCATGEEAYSIAMLLAEHAGTLRDNPGFEVFATDIDEYAIRMARKGAYSSNDAADLSPERLERFFTAVDGTHQVRKELRERVLFAPHNVLQDPPFSQIDLVSCRNLLIYLTRTAQRRLVEIMHFALNPGGVLFLGSAESIDGMDDLFTAADKEARLFESRPDSARVSLPPREFKIPARAAGRRLTDQVTLRDGAGLPAVLHHRLLEQYAPPSVVVNEHYDIVHLSERAGRYLRHKAGEPSHNLLSQLRPALRLDVRIALHQASREQVSVATRTRAIALDGELVSVTTTVRPVFGEGDTPPGFFLVLFEEDAARPEADRASDVRVIEDGEAGHPLEEELLRVGDQLRISAEQHTSQTAELTASNEELQAMNEELRSSTEELETSKEELQSLNEELRTVNQELKTTIDEQIQANDDIENLIKSAGIATIFLDSRSRIKLFTPTAREIFNLIPADRGRALSDITHLLLDADLDADIAQVLDAVPQVERELQTRDGRWQLMRVVPYRTAAHRVDGVVLTFVDITARKRDEMELLELKEALETELKAMTGLHELSARLLQGGELQPLLHEVALAAIRIQGAAFAAIELYDPQTGALRTVAHAASEPDSFVPEDDAEDSEWAGHAVLRRGERIVIADLASGADAGPYRRRAAAFACRSVQATPLLNRRGEPLGVLATYLRRAGLPTPRELRILDLYARQAAEVIDFIGTQRALRESRERLRQALDVETVGVLFFTSGGIITHVNDAFLRMSGHSRSELEGKAPIDPLTASDWMRESMRALDELERAGRMGGFETEYTRKDGSRWWALVAAGRLSDEEAVTFVIDITASKHGQEQLRQSEARLRLIADSVTDYAIFTTTTEGLIDSWNRGAARMFGYTEPEVAGRPGAIIFTPEDQAAGAPAEEMRLARETGRADDERWHMRKDGSRFFVSGIMAPLLDSHDALVGYVKIARDLTERKHWEDALQRAHADLEDRVQQRTEALASANADLDLELRERRAAEERIRGLMERLITAQEDERRRIARDLHDHLGQQVAGLSLNIQALEQAVRNDPGSRELVSDAQAIISTLDRDLDFLAWELRPPAFDELGLAITLGNFVREWSKNFEISADFHTRGLDNVRLSYEIETNLYRIAQEALNNIYKHARANRVGVMLERRDRQVVLVVEDDGCGFGPSGRDGDNQDRGLGLVGMHERAALVGGTLDIETSPETGTTVFVRTPFVPAAQMDAGRLEE